MIKYIKKIIALRKIVWLAVAAFPKVLILGKFVKGQKP
jgi:hypothetical protein